MDVNHKISTPGNPTEPVGFSLVGFDARFDFMTWRFRDSKIPLSPVFVAF